MAATAPPKPSRRRLTIGRRLFYTHLLVALLVAFGLGAYLHWAAEGELRRALNARVQDNATLVAQALGQDAWESITGAADVERPEYRVLQSQLRSLTENNHAVERVLVLRRNENALAVVADSLGNLAGYAPGDAIPGLSPRSLQDLSQPKVLRNFGAFNAAAEVPGRELDYAVLLHVKADDIADQLYELRRNSALSFVVAVALALAMSVWLALSARRVLQRFAARFREIAEGESGHKLELRADDEFSDLAVALEDMSSRITQSQNEREGALTDLKAARDRLQEMVRERSAELEKLNVMLRSEIEQRCQLEAALAEAAATDTMTHLLNRRGMLEVLDHAAEQARRQRGAFTVLIGDIDHFKRINDQYGHQVGDQVLIAMGRRLKTSLGHKDAAARWGGEEFLLLWPGFSVTEAEKRGNELREAIGAGPIFPGGPQITVSFGIAEFTGLDTVERCVNRADKALYRAKQEGRNRVHVGV
jgi:diguanylate cyclase (GGDEF)-like protein